jgi:hypothetical protein
VVILAALRSHVDTVVDVVGPDFRGVVGGSPTGTLLHHAAWVGDAAIVYRLLERGARPESLDGGGFATPLSWAALSSGTDPRPDRDHIGVAEALVEAGDPIEPHLVDVAGGPLRDLLAARA